MVQNILILIAGLAALVAGGELLVRGATSMALRIKISPLVVGLTIVAFGTSAPELLISLRSALAGSPDLALGNVVGSNICNLTLVLGFTAAIFPVGVHSDSLKIDWPVTMGSAVLLFLLSWNGWIGLGEGTFFIVCLFSYTYFIIRRSQKKITIDMATEDQSDVAAAPSTSAWKDVLFIAIGSLGLSFGSEWFVSGAQAIAVAFGVSERVVGLTIVALGTSLPELMTSCIAAFKKETDIALGNLLGSNIFNVFSILGFTSVIQAVKINPDIRNTDMVWMLAITLLILPLMYTGRKINRLEGILLLLVYAGYLYSVVM